MFLYWYQSYHWYQWTIGLTNRIRLCTLDMCGGEKTPPSQSEPAYQVSYFIIRNTNLKITRTLCVKTVSLFHKEQTFHVSVDPDANQLCQVQFTMKFKKVEMNSIAYILCKSFLEAKCMLTMSTWVHIRYIVVYPYISCVPMFTLVILYTLYTPIYPVYPCLPQ